MQSLAALPTLKMLSQSVRVVDRMSFIRIFHDYSAFLRANSEVVPSEWLYALNDCLEATRLEQHTSKPSAAGLQGEDLTELVSAAFRQRLSPTESTTETQRALHSDDATLMDPPTLTRTARGFNHLLAEVGNQIMGEPVPPYTLSPSNNALAVSSDEYDLDTLDLPTAERSRQIDGKVLALLVARARDDLKVTGDRRLAIQILAKKPTQLEMAPLFLEANPEQRRAIILVAQRAELSRRHASAFATVGRGAIATLECAAITGNAQKFYELLARAIGAPRDLVLRIANDPTGEPLALVLIAIGAPNDVCVRIVTAKDINDRGQFCRVHAFARLSESITPFVARRILTAIVNDQISARPKASSQLMTRLRRSSDERDMPSREPVTRHSNRDALNLRRSTPQAQNTRMP